MPGIETLVDGLDHPEGVVWDAGAGVLYAGGEAGQVYEVDLEQRRWRQVAEAPGFVLGLVVRLDGTVPDGLAFTDGGGSPARPPRRREPRPPAPRARGDRAARGPAPFSGELGGRRMRLGLDFLPARSSGAAGGTGPEGTVW